MTRHTDAASSPQPQASGDFLPAARLPNQIHRLPAARGAGKYSLPG